MTDKSLASSAETSPDALLKQAILGARASAEKAAAAAPIRAARRLDPRLAGVVAAALGLGALIGAGATALTGARQSETGDAVAQLRHQVEALRTESERQAERLGKGLAQVQEATDAVRSEAKSRGTTLAERIGRSEQSLATKITTMGDRLEQADKELSARFAAISALVEKRGVVPASPPPAPQAAKPAVPEPTETGALPDKPKTVTIEGWAVREVYDGVAVLEDRKRRLVEVSHGDTIPGVGRVETIERRGKTWVVVTKQGLITPQAW